MATASQTFFGIPFVTGGAGDIQGSDDGEFIVGSDGDDDIRAGGGRDFVFAAAGDDIVDAGDGDDAILGSSGADTLIGGDGDDLLNGGGDGDVYAFDPSNEGEGDDVIVGFSLDEGDVIELNTIDIVRSTEGVLEADPAGDPTALSVSDLDAILSDPDRTDWNIRADDNGDAVVDHPNGSITLAGIQVADLPEGTNFTTLAELGAISLVGPTAGFVVGSDESEAIDGSEGDDVILAQGGDDTVSGLEGNDTLEGGEGSDAFAFNPNRPGEGDDVIADFVVGTDVVALIRSEVAAATTDVTIGDDASSAEIAALLDTSDQWGLRADDATGDAIVDHPNGTIALAGIPASALEEASFAFLESQGVLLIEEDSFSVIG